MNQTTTAIDQKYIELNNLYLAVERGSIKMNIHVGNTLRVLVSEVYSYGDPMVDYWEREFQKLPNWNDF